jgi:nucleoside-diphosphate-sugar epimerase
MRILVTGAGGFIGRYLLAALPDAQPIPHHQMPTLPLDDVGVVIHAGRYRPADPAKWRLEEDPEAHLLERLAHSAARYVMLSTRTVYGRASSFILSEADPLRPATAYGRHKLALEERGRLLLGDRLTIARLSNVFGFEWPGRATFFGIMQERLAREGQVNFDMAAETRRDFIPVEAAARAIAALALDGRPATVNVGSGHAVACGALAQALIDGFGHGRLVVTDHTVKDEFVLNTSQLQARTGLLLAEADILEAARRAGRQLACTTSGR